MMPYLLPSAQFMLMVSIGMNLRLNDAAGWAGNYFLARAMVPASTNVAGQVRARCDGWPAPTFFTQRTA